VFVVLGIQHAKDMHPIMSSVAYPVLVYFSTIFHNGIVFGKTLRIKKCVF